MIPVKFFLQRRTLEGNLAKFQAFCILNTQGKSILWISYLWIWTMQCLDRLRKMIKHQHTFLWQIFLKNVLPYILFCDKFSSKMCCPTSNFVSNFSQRCVALYPYWVFVTHFPQRCVALHPFLWQIFLKDALPYISFCDKFSSKRCCPASMYPFLWQIFLKDVLP